MAQRVSWGKGGADEPTLSGRVECTRARGTGDTLERRAIPGSQAQRAQILRTADAGVSDEQIARTIAVSLSTVY